MKKFFGRVISIIFLAVIVGALLPVLTIEAAQEKGQSPETAIVCETEGMAKAALISAASRITDTEYHDLYLLSAAEPTGTCLRETFGSAIEYSHTAVPDENAEEGGLTLHLFRIRRLFREDCPHRYLTLADTQPTCEKRGMLWYRCELCGRETTVYRPPLGHADEDSDGICDACGLDALAPIKETRWNIGDKVAETVHGTEYAFTCVCEDYTDCFGNHTGAALFLCDAVIPAQTGGEYREETDGTGHLQKVWYPGPIAEFGVNNNYRTSKIRQFLDASETKVAVAAQIGTRTSYTGATASGKFSQMSAEGLSAADIGTQLLTAKLFILSVEEAVACRQYLWRFEGAEDDPQSAVNGTCSGYWLRTPFGSAADHAETDMAYIVDLADGSIRPAGIHPQASTGDPYIDTQTTIGVRPAFLLPNN